MTATILVVDDEPDLEALVLQKFRRQIRDGAVQFVFAHDGIEALAVDRAESARRHGGVRHQHAADGRPVAAAKLQEAEDKKSTIIVSAYGDMSNIRTAMNRGAFDFLTKPIDFGDLEMTIDKTIRHVEMMREARRRQPEAERAHASLSRYFSPQIAATARRRRRRQRHGGALARGRDHLHRHHRLHLAGGDRGARGAGRAAQRICRRHDRRRVCP